MNQAQFKTSIQKPCEPKGSMEKVPIACESCDLYGILELLSCNSGDLESFGCLLRGQQSVVKGESLFRSGQPFHAAYAVSRGAFVSYQLLEGYKERVLGFHFPGELIGFDVVQQSNYGYSVRALELSSVCVLEFEERHKLGERYLELQEQMIRIMSGQIAQIKQQFLLTTRQSAEERLAAFLLDIIRRLVKRGCSVEQIILPMSRKDVGNYLGLAAETVSRELKCLEAKGAIMVRGKRISLLNTKSLSGSTQHQS